MEREGARLQRKPAASRQPSAQPLHSSVETRRPPDGSQPQKTPRRSTAARLAVEVELLAAELAQSRARIVDLEAKVEIDPLTELLNRRGFERELKRSIAYVKRYGVSAALVFLDLDAFKPVNDRHGHAAGDAVLKAAAATLVRNVRASDAVARLGGDEFVVLLWNLSGPAAVAKAAALERAIFATEVEWGSSTLVVGASAGVALIGALDSSAELLARADADMYARKEERQFGTAARR
ncbi:MAG: GGDEF domain-containing protein [Xanthobacteraceae bacterium]